MFQSDQQILEWLLEGDVSIQYLVYKDLLGEERPDLQMRIESEGWGKRFLDAQNPDGHWGRSFYQPKWTSTHYSVLDLRNLNIRRDHPVVEEIVTRIAAEEKADDGGIDPSKTTNKSDVCIQGMFMHYACYFGIDEKHLESVIDFVISQHMPDGGFNCRSNRTGARHSSVHTTISMLEGILTYRKYGYSYKLETLEKMESQSIEFLLMHHLFKSDRTGEIINKDFLKLAYPSRWKYDILRALEYFADTELPWDIRMLDALQVLQEKRTKEGLWKLQAYYPGQLHFRMEEPGRISRWNTLRAFKVMKKYGNFLNS